MASRFRGIAAPLKPDLLKILREQLTEGERLAWATSPDPRAMAGKPRSAERRDAVAILGGGYATLGAVVMALKTKQWLWLLVPLVLIALAATIYLVARWLRSRARWRVEGTVYGITTRRALIIHTYPTLSVETLPIESITDVTVGEARDDCADLILRARSNIFTFRKIDEPERSKSQIMRVMRDPKTTEQEILAAEAYATQMRQLMVKSGPR